MELLVLNYMMTVIPKKASCTLLNIYICITSTELIFLSDIIPLWYHPVNS